MNNVTWDWPLFEALNFDGPDWLDQTMVLASGLKVWLPLYLLIIYMVWRRYSWQGLLALVVGLGVAIAMADITAGIFKHQGPLADLWPSFPARLRPMHTPDGLEFYSNTYSTGYIFGTVSGHTATIVAIAILCSVAVGRRWFTWLITAVALLVCYSRIYLACHFPQDILLGAMVGLISGVVGIWLFRRVVQLNLGRKN